MPRRVEKHANRIKILKICMQIVNFCSHQDVALLGIDKEVWDGLIKRLQSHLGVISKRGLKKEIQKMNEEIFKEKGLIALYGEYG